MSIFGKNEILPIGVDLGSKYLKLAQLRETSEGLELVAAAKVCLPDDIENGSASWQRWTVSCIKDILNEGGFRGRTVVAGIAIDDVFIDHLRLTCSDTTHIEKVILEKIKQQIPFEPEGAMLKYVMTDAEKAGDYDVVVMAAEKLKVERHLAIFETAKLEVESISAWPFAITNSFVNFFGRRENDADTAVVLLDTGTRHTNVVISKQKEILFARSVDFGVYDINSGKNSEKLISEIQACIRYFENTYVDTIIDRIVLLSSEKTEAQVCKAVAELGRELGILAQLADVVNAVKIDENCVMNFDKRDNDVDFSVAVGLSLSA